MKITKLEVVDLRFPTSQHLDGSDAMNPDPDYSASYVIVHTDNEKYKGHGLCFTIGRGNEICVKAVESLQHLILNKKLSDFTSNMGHFWRHLVSDSQLRWLGPEKGVIHMATAAIVNAVWDLWAKVENKPLWQLICDLTSEELINCLDFRYIRDALSPSEALEILQNIESSKSIRQQEMQNHGVKAYTTSAGWLGYSDEKLFKLCQQALADGFTHIKLKVGQNLQDDIRRLTIAREAIGDNNFLMIDANQVWDVNQAIDYVAKLQKFNLYWVEEPTSPDDILGHQKIKNAINPINVATGEHCHNKIMFKQFMQAKAIDICQIDSCRVAGVNEILSILLLAKKFNIPVCPHAGGVGLCEYTQHLSIIDYIAISGDKSNTVLEYVDHLHQHFIDPVVMKNGYYQVPTKPGYSIEVFPQSLADYQFPQGKIWSEA